MLVACAAMFGTAGTAQALGPDTSTPLGVAAARLLIGGLVMLALLPRLGHSYAEVLMLVRSRTVWLAAVCSLMFQVGYFTGASLAGVALGALIIMGSVPLFSGFLGLFIGHRITASWLLATAICATGLVLLSADGITAGNPLGVVVALLGGFAGACFTVVVKRMSDRGIATVPATVTAYLLAGPAIIVLAIATGASLAWVASPSGVALALYLGVVAMAIPNVLWVKGMAHLAPGPSSTLMLTEPAVATLLGIIVLGETLAPAGVIGLVLVLLGLLLQGIVASRTPKMLDEPLAPL